MLDKTTARKFIPPRRRARKVTAYGLSSRANARDLRKISPFGRNDNARPLRLCARHVLLIPSSAENFKYLWLVPRHGCRLAAGIQRRQSITAHSSNEGPAAPIRTRRVFLFPKA